MNKTVLVVAAHSDDEALGCAGTIAKHVAAGDAVHVIYMADGVSSRDVSGAEVNQRWTLAQQACEILGVFSTKSFNFPDNKMDSIPLLDIVQAIEAEIKKTHPEIIYTHHIGDLNVDHQITHKALLVACRPQPGSSVKEVYSFEVLSSTEWQTPGVNVFCPNVYVDITEFIEIKKKVLSVYSEEMRQPPHTRSIENALRLCELRGSAVGIKSAEAFMCIREIK